MVVDDKDNMTIPKAIQFTAGRIAQEYNQRKKRKGAYWEDRYHATAIETGRYLLRCLVYIDLNEDVVEELVRQSAPGLLRAISRTTDHILNALTIEEPDPGPPAGAWSQTHPVQNTGQRLFRRILVGISKDDKKRQSLAQAILIAGNENSILQALYVVPTANMVDTPETDGIIAEFNRRCKEASIDGDIAVEVGDAARKICQRAQWTDLVIGKMTHPPANRLLARLSSGFRIMVQRCSRPILAVPTKATKISKVLLAYNGNPKADEALFIATYMADRWQLPLHVLTVTRNGINADAVQVTQSTC
jgi:hypothetical protein